MSAAPMFPIMDDPIIKALPLAMLQEHEAQALRNHSQSLRTLAQRGGLGIDEAYCVLTDTPCRRFAHESQVRRALMVMADKFEKARRASTEDQP